MALDSYTNLQTAILKWLRRPGDALISSDVPDMIRLFEVEADRRLRTRWSEATVDLAPNPGEKLVALPLDFRSLRSIRLSSADPVLNFRYLTPEQLTLSTGGYFTLEGLLLRLPEPAARGQIIRIGYIQGLTPLSGTISTNWLLAKHPDAYLFGSLVEAEVFVQNDERAVGWLRRREGAFASIIEADAAARWGGGGMQMRPDWVRLQGELPSAGSTEDDDLDMVTSITLNVNATSTMLTHPAIHPSSFIQLSPRTEPAAQSLVMGIWVIPGDGQATINHVSYDVGDQTFNVLIR